MSTRNRPSLSILAVLLAFLANGQNVNPAHPQEIQAQKVPTAEEMRVRLGRDQVQKDAQELSELCAKFPGDIEQMKQGLLPKDTVEKLKRMEKLSKRLREELTR